MVFGTQVYLDESVICKAAVHSGVIPPEGGTLIFELANGMELYQGSVQNGVHTISHAFGLRSFVCKRYYDGSSQLMKCDETAQPDKLFMDIGEKVKIKCESKCL